CQHNFGTPFTF
nr:immunoglobulin light chain junction region [Macaca mulatta]MOW73988.1 immunoglobulin light chain junction region [Macaca mulatta]